MQEHELTWTEKFNLIEEQLKTDAARIDMLIARTIGLDKVSKATVYRVREVLEGDGRIERVPTGARISTNGTIVSPNRADLPDNRSGNRIGVPDGKTVANLIREGLKAEEGGMSAEEAARSVGIGSRSYAEGRAIVLLLDKQDLLPSEQTMVNESVFMMNESRRTALAHKRLKDLIHRVWGDRHNPRTRKGAQKRAASFSHAMTIVMDACMAAPDMHVPALSAEETATAVQQLDEAVANLRKLKRKVVEGRWS